LDLPDYNGRGHCAKQKRSSKEDRCGYESGLIFMKIAQVSPLFESVPPKAYGGTERVISYLTEELVKRGHEVTLFASGDSITNASLVSAVPASIRADPKDLSWLAYHTMHMDLVSQLSHSFDIIHFHTDYLHFPLARKIGAPHVTTLHGRQDLPELAPLYRQFADMPLVSISNSQRTPLPNANWIDTVYHGLPADLYSFCPAPGDYFAFVGRVSREKRLDRAIEIAEKCGMPLYIAAKIDKADEAYFNEYIKPLFRKPFVTYVGEVGEKEKRELLEHAAALLFPIDWPEPFGLVMIEAFSCGTPVIAYQNGSIPEIMEDGVTGFVVSNQDEAVRAAMRIDEIDRKGCRDAFERRYTAAGMADNYLRVYRSLLSR
jgi:glycosyltransferase involved in cell wall biosynthesis